MSIARKISPNPETHRRNVVWAMRYTAGESLAQIAESVGRAEYTVYEAIAGLVEFRKPGRRAIQPDQIDMSVDTPQTRTIKLYTEGKKVRELAAQFGVSRYRVAKWLRDAASARSAPAPAPPPPIGKFGLDHTNLQFVKRIWKYGAEHGTLPYSAESCRALLREVA